MSKKGKVNRAVKMLEQKGFKAEQHVSALAMYIGMQILAFQLQEQHHELDGKLYLDLFMNTDLQMQGLFLECYTARWVPAMVFPHTIINGVDTRILQQRLDQIDWKKNGPQVYRSFFAGRAGHDENATNVLKDLFSLGKGPDPEGMVARDQLVYNYLMGTGIEWYIDCQQVTQQFEIIGHYHTLDDMPDVAQARQHLRQLFMQQRRLVTVRQHRGLPGRPGFPRLRP